MMIDFKNALFVKLHHVPEDTFNALIAPILVSDEKIIGAFQALRDGVAFTNKRMIAINVEGVTGKKKDFTSMPYNKIEAFSVETAGVMDPDSVLELCFAGLGVVRFEFESCTNILDICRLISENIFC